MLANIGRARFEQLDLTMLTGLSAFALVTLAVAFTAARLAVLKK